MLLKKITLHNFRQFSGTQSVEFSTDLEKNVTVVLAENGSGKTTLAQAFTWVLYGSTDFKIKEVVNAANMEDLVPGTSSTVKVVLELIHNQVEYIITRKQLYNKLSNGKTRSDNSVLSIKRVIDGQQKTVNEELSLVIKQILPKNLSRYFFFDGERIEKMGKDIEDMKANEDFADAVKGLLGLNALAAAIDHFGTRSSGVIGRLEAKIDEKSNSKVVQLGKVIDKEQESVEAAKRRIGEIDEEINRLQELYSKLSIEIQQYAETERFEKAAQEVQRKINNLQADRVRLYKQTFKMFSKKTVNYLAQPLLKDALEILKNEEVIDKGIPELHAKTIEHLIDRGICLCGHEIGEGSKELQELRKLLEYVPPRSIGTEIGIFVDKTHTYIKNGEDVYANIIETVKQNAKIGEAISEAENNLEKYDKAILKVQNMGEKKSRQKVIETQIKSLKDEKSAKDRSIGKSEIEMKRALAERESLLLVDKQNIEYRRYRDYAKTVAEEITRTYRAKEIDTKRELEETINRVFNSIYDGQMQVQMDENYKVEVIVKDLGARVEKSTAQSISVIFAFIAGIIEMAKKRTKQIGQMPGDDAEDLLVSEPYPLVMDAPLSAFDKRRIKNVCTVLPEIAEQVIIFIKDTDGDIAEEHMKHIIGKRFYLHKEDETHTMIKER